MKRIAVTAGSDRYVNITRALELLGDEMQLAGRHSIVIKPNFVSTSIPLAATHVDAVRAVLDFLKTRGIKDVTIAEGAAGEDTLGGFENFGYVDLAREYDIRLVDLNRDEAVPAQIYGWDLRPITVSLAKTIVESDFRISVTPPKTHDTVIVTASLKNLIMGSLVNRSARNKVNPDGILERLRTFVPARFQTINVIRPAWTRLVRRIYQSDKMMVHQGFPAANLNLFLLARVIPPHLSVIDGFTAMEGDGPVMGTPVDLGVAIASTDFVAADSLAAYLMGFEPRDIGYLAYSAENGLGTIELEQMQVIGEDPFQHRRRFKPHSVYQQQLRWRSPRLGELAANAGRLSICCLTK